MRRSISIGIAAMLALGVGFAFRPHPPRAQQIELRFGGMTNLTGQGRSSVFVITNGTGRAVSYARFKVERWENGSWGNCPPFERSEGWKHFVGILQPSETCVVTIAEFPAHQICRLLVITSPEVAGVTGIANRLSERLMGITFFGASTFATVPGPALLNGMPVEVPEAEPNRVERAAASRLGFKAAGFMNTLRH